MAKGNFIACVRPYFSPIISRANADDVNVGVKSNSIHDPFGGSDGIEGVAGSKAHCFVEFVFSSDMKIIVVRSVNAYNIATSSCRTGVALSFYKIVNGGMVKPEKIRG